MFKIILSLSVLFFSSSLHAEKKTKIAMIPKAVDNVFWQVVKKGAEKAAKEENIELIWKGPAISNDDRSQIEVIQSFNNSDVDVIAIAPINNRSLQKPVEISIKNGKKIILFDSLLADASVAASFVCTDNKKAGAKCAEEMAKALGEKGNIIICRYIEGCVSTTLREEAFLKAIKKYKNIKLLSSDIYCRRPEDGIKAIEKYPTVDGIFCSNLVSTEMICLALRKKNLAGKKQSHRF